MKKLILIALLMNSLSHAMEILDKKKKIEKRKKQSEPYILMECSETCCAVSLYCCCVVIVTGDKLAQAVHQKFQKNTARRME